MIKSLCLVFLTVVPASFGQTPPDWILRGGKIFTSDPIHPWVEAIAIRGDRIVAAGSDTSVLATSEAGTRFTDLRGRTVIPGINDAHIHVWHTHIFPAAGISAGTVGMNEPSLDEVLKAIRGRRAAAVEGSWITAEVGGTVLSDPAANRFTLDKIAPSHRVLLAGWAGHAAVLNSAGLRALGVTEEEPDPIGGWYQRVAGTRQVNGVLLGNATNVLMCLMATVPPPAVAQRLQLFFQEALSLGITSIQNMSGLSPVTVLQALERAKPQLRWREIPVADGPPERCAGPKPTGDPDPNPMPLVSVSGIKFALDGTPIEWLAWMRGPYADRTDISGVPYLTEKQIAVRIAAAQTKGVQPLFHAGGDRATETALRELSLAPEPATIHRLRPRIEHGDWVPPRSHALARVLGVVVVQNPSHFTLPELFLSRFGADRMKRVFLLKSLLKARIPVAFGSDGLLNPYLNLLFATTVPANPAEALTREEAIVAYTRTSAYSEFAEKEKGTLAPGMLADFAVLSQDIFSAPPDALGATRSVMTVVGGRVVFDAGVI